MIKIAKISFSDIQNEKLTRLHKLDSFDCGDDDINDFLKSDALGYQENLLATTTLFIYKEEIVGFFSASSDSIKLRQSEKKEHQVDKKKISEYPAVKIARLGRDKNFKDQEIGEKILKWAMGYIVSHCKKIGTRFVTVDAYPNKVKWYEKFGFKRNQHKDYEEKRNVSMRYDLLNPPKE